MAAKHGRRVLTQLKGELVWDTGAPCVGLKFHCMLNERLLRRHRESCCSLEFGSSLFFTKSLSHVDM